MMVAILEFRYKYPKSMFWITLNPENCRINVLDQFPWKQDLNLTPKCWYNTNV